MYNRFFFLQTATVVGKDTDYCRAYVFFKLHFFIPSFSLLILSSSLSLIGVFSLRSHSSDSQLFSLISSSFPIGYCGSLGVGRGVWVSGSSTLSVGCWHGTSFALAHRSKLLWGVGRGFWFSLHGSILGCYCGAPLAGAIRRVHCWLKLYLGFHFFFWWFVGMKRLWTWVIRICVWFVGMGWRFVVVVVVFKICCRGWSTWGNWWVWVWVAIYKMLCLA